jgi:hypothetical protein
MTTLGLLVLFLVPIVLVALAVLARFWPIHTVFIRVSWIPLVALLVQAILWKPLLARLSYFAVLLPILTGVLSLLLAIVGTTLILSKSSPPERARALLIANFAALTPAILLLGFLLFSFVSGLIGP